LALSLARALLITGLCISVTTEAGAASPPIAQREHLLLLAEGTENAITERYLRELCTLLGRAPSTHNKFSTISVFRQAPQDIVSIAGRVLQDIHTGMQPEARELARLTDLVVQNEHICHEEPPAPDEAHAAQRTRLIRLEWIGGPMATELRVQEGFLGPSHTELFAPKYIPVLKD
jgi:hypothetical protein